MSLTGLLVLAGNLLKGSVRSLRSIERLFAMKNMFVEAQQESWYKQKKPVARTYDERYPLSYEITSVPSTSKLHNVSLLKLGRVTGDTSPLLPTKEIVVSFLFVDDEKAA